MAEQNHSGSECDQVPGGEVEGRRPKGFVESLLANCRPQPGIPALLVLFLTLVIAVLSQDPQAPPDAERSVLSLLIPVGIVVSCGLGIAAGFCSFFPPLGWSLVAWWGLTLTEAGPLPAYNRYVLLAGIAASALMLMLQLWRVVTGRFVPTIRNGHEPRPPQPP
jgi:hypothetical protein